MQERDRGKERERERERREEGGGERAGMGMVESDRKGQKEGGMN